MPVLDYLRSIGARLTSAAWSRIKALEDIHASLGWSIAVRSTLQAAAADLRVRTRTQALDGRAGQALEPATHLPLKDAVLFIGHVEAGLGLGQSLRGLIEAAEAAGLPFAILPYNHKVEQRYIGAFRSELYDRSGRYLINLVEVAPDQVEYLLYELGPERREGSYSILRSYWELARAPDEWAAPLSAFDEIWAPSQFVADALRGVVDKPVYIVPPAVDVTIVKRWSRSDWNLDPTAFLFVYSFDLGSYPARKNPLGVVQAFRLAFPDPSLNVGLVLKHTGAPGVFEAYRAALQLLARTDPRIIVIDHEMERDEVLSLIATCDAYLSLHRSEGLGLGMIEAMMLGKPVIATDYSGSRDFLTPSTGFPIQHTLTRVHRHEYPHAERQHWAEPDLQHAARTMRAIHAGAPNVAAIARSGQTAAIARYGVDAVGSAVRTRLEQVYEQLGRKLPPSGSTRS